MKNLPNTNLTVEKLARQIHISERQLYRKVKATIQLTPHQYIADIRFEAAYTYLKQKKFSTIVETAKAVGYKDAGYFARQFKARYGITPLELLNTA